VDVGGDSFLPVQPAGEDEVGTSRVSLAALAERLGVKPPALYKHVDNLADLQDKIAALAMAEFGDALRDALPGKAGLGALTVAFTPLRKVAPLVHRLLALETRGPPRQFRDRRVYSTASGAARPR